MLAVHFGELLLDPTSRAEFEALVSVFNRLWMVEHNEDGTHNIPTTTTPATFDFATWTPLLSGTTGAVGQAYTLQQGYAVKINRFFAATFAITLSAKGVIGGTVEVQGIPYALADSSMVIPSFANMGTNWISLGGRKNQNTTITVTGMQAAGASSATLVDADIANTTDWKGLIIGVTYA